jgi:hypothetical protein
MYYFIDKVQIQVCHKFSLNFKVLKYLQHQIESHTPMIKIF